MWDLRGKREVVALAYGGGAGTLASQSGAGVGMAVGGRRGMSDIAWHPDNVGHSSPLLFRCSPVFQATRLVTASEDDSSPIIMMWDLRNARAPEKVSEFVFKKNGLIGLSPVRFLLATRKVSFLYRGVSRMQIFCSLVVKIIVLFVGIRKHQISLERYCFSSDSAVTFVQIKF